MRNRLETEIINTLFPYRKELPMEDIRAQIRIALSNFQDPKGRESATGALYTYGYVVAPHLWNYFKKGDRNEDNTNRDLEWARTI